MTSSSSPIIDKILNININNSSIAIDKVETYKYVSIQLIMTQDLQAKNAQLPFVLISMFKLLKNLVTTMLQLQVIQLFSLSAVEHMTSFEETLHSCETVPVSSSNTNTHQLTKME